MHRGAGGSTRAAVGAMFAAAVLSTGGAQAAEGAERASSCVTCHTDMAKLQEEAKGIPVPTGSALQSGKG